MNMLAAVDARLAVIRDAMPRIRATLAPEFRAEHQRALIEVSMAALQSGKTDEDGRVIGLRVPEALRDRLDRQARQHGVRYSHVVMSAVRIGVAILEMLPTPRHRQPRVVEAEPFVPPPPDPDEPVEEPADDPE